MPPVTPAGATPQAYADECGFSDHHALLSKRLKKVQAVALYLLVQGLSKVSK